MNDSYTQRAHISRAVQPRGDRRGVDDGRGRLPADVVEAHEGEPAAGRVLAEAVVPRTVNGTGHTGPSEFCATSI